MTKRFGKARVQGCECKYNFTCRHCLEDSAQKQGLTARRVETRPLRLVEWVPGRHWLCYASDGGFTPVSEVRVGATNPPIPPWRVGANATEQGVEVKEERERELILADGRAIAHVRVQPQ